MLLVHEMMAQAGTAAGYATIREFDIESAQCRGDAQDDETVAEADGRVSTNMSMELRCTEQNI